MAFTPTSLGADTSGAWSVYFDGSDVNLSSADLDALWVDGSGNLFLSLGDDANIFGLNVSDEDVIAFQASSLGEETDGIFASTLFFDGSKVGIEDDVFGFSRLG